MHGKLFRRWEIMGAHRSAERSSAQWFPSQRHVNLACEPLFVTIALFNDGGKSFTCSERERESGKLARSKTIGEDRKLSYRQVVVARCCFVQEKKKTLWMTG